MEQKSILLVALSFDCYLIDYSKKFNGYTCAELSGEQLCKTVQDGKTEGNGLVGGDDQFSRLQGQGERPLSGCRGESSGAGRG